MKTKHILNLFLALSMSLPGVLGSPVFAEEENVQTEQPDPAENPDGQTAENPEDPSGQEPENPDSGSDDSGTQPEENKTDGGEQQPDTNGEQKPDAGDAQNPQEDAAGDVKNTEDAEEKAEPEEQADSDDAVVEGNIIKYQGLEYTITSDSTCTLSSLGNGGNLVIPKEVTAEGKTYLITDLGQFLGTWDMNPNMNNFPKLYSIDLSACTGLKTIRRRAFSTGNVGFRTLNTVKLPETIETIPDWCFAFCSNLHSINFPASLKSIGYGAFAYDSLYSIDMSQCTQITKLPGYVFERNGDHRGSCPTILPPNLQSFDNASQSSTWGGTFEDSNCQITNLAELDSLTYIGNYAFNNMSNMRKWVLPANVQTVGISAFGSYKNPEIIDLSGLKTNLTVKDKGFATFSYSQTAAVCVIMPQDPNVQVSFSTQALSYRTDPKVGCSFVFTWPNYTAENIEAIKAQPGVNNPNVKVVETPHLSLSKDAGNTSFPDPTESVMQYQDGSILKAGSTPIQTIDIYNQNGSLVSQQNFDYGTWNSPQWSDCLNNDVSSVDLSGLHAGTYTAVATNYGSVSNSEAPFSFTITQADNAWTEELTMAEKINYGTAPAPSAQAKFGPVKYLYSSSQNGSYSEQAPAQVGDWWVKAVVEETPDWKGLESLPLHFEIAKSVPPYETPSDLHATYGQSLSDVQLPAGFTWQQPQNTPVGDAGVHTFKATYTPDDTLNYQIVHDIEISVTVDQARNEWTEQPSIEGWTYGEGSSSPKGAAKYGTVLYSYKAADDSEEDWSDKQPIAAGNYLMKAEVAETRNYSGLSADPIPFTIAKGKAPIQLPVFKGVYGQTFKDLERQLPKGCAFEKPLDTPLGDTGKHEVTVIYTPEDSSYETVSLTAELEVAKAPNKWTKKPSVKGWTYGESASAPEAAAQFGTPVFTWSDSKDGEFTDDVPADAGTWYLKASVAGTDNYEPLESRPVKFVIEPKELNDSNTTISPIDQKTDLKTVTVKTGDTTLVLDKDYTVQTKSKGKTVTVTFTFKGNYKGQVTRSYDRTGTDSNSGSTTNNGAGSGNKPSAASGRRPSANTAMATGIGGFAAAALSALGGMALLSRKKKNRK